MTAILEEGMRGYSTYCAAHEAHHAGKSITAEQGGALFGIAVAACSDKVRREARLLYLDIIDDKNKDGAPIHPDHDDVNLLLYKAVTVDEFDPRLHIEMRNLLVSLMPCLPPAESERVLAELVDRVKREDAENDPKNEDRLRAAETLEAILGDCHNEKLRTRAMAEELFVIAFDSDPVLGWTALQTLEKFEAVPQTPGARVTHFRQKLAVFQPGS